MDVQINFWNGKKPLHIEAENTKDALEKAIKTGADLTGADLRGADLRDADLTDADLTDADLRDADLRGAKYRDKKLWTNRPVLQLGPCGSASRITMVFFFANKSEPFVKCGRFEGTITGFEAKINETHGDNFSGEEYRAMLLYIKEVRRIQIGWVSK